MKESAGDLRDRQLDQIATLGRLLLASVDEDEVLVQVARGICEFGSISRCLIAAYSDSDEMLQGRAGWNLDQAAVRQVREHVEAIPVVHEAVESRQILLVPRPREDPTIPPFYLDLFGVQGSIAVVPLVSPELGVLGVAVVDQGGETFELSDEQLRAMAVFGDLATMAMRHGRFVEQGRRLAAAVERNRVAAELHDSISQNLHAARLALTELVEHPAMAGEVQDLAERAHALTGDAVAAIHQALFALAEEEGPESSALIDRIRDHLGEFGDSSGISVDLSVLGEGDEPPERIARAILRAVREGLTNVAKYADATEVVVSIRRGRGWWSVDVSDDGTGDPTVVRRHLAPSAEHFGLGSLAGDARRLGGRLYVGRAPRLGGISLSLSVPVDP